MAIEWIRVEDGRHPEISVLATGWHGGNPDSGLRWYLIADAFTDGSWCESETGELLYTPTHYAEINPPE